MSSEIEDCRATLIATELKLAKEPNNAQLLALKEDLISLLELSEELTKDEQEQKTKEKQKQRDESDQSKSLANKLSVQEAAKEAAKLDKKRKKKAKMKEKVKEQLEVAEKEKHAWQSFIHKGVKGLKKSSIFASPNSVSGRVGVGTNGIADAQPAFSKKQEKTRATRVIQTTCNSSGDRR